MKTRMFIISSILAFQISILFANPTIVSVESRPVERVAIELAPVAPSEAEFSDLLPEADASAALLIPVTPKEASFDEDLLTEPYTSDDTVSSILIPSAPETADFEDAN